MTTYTGYLYDADGTRVAKGTIRKWSCDPSTNGFTTTNDFVLGLGGEQVTEMGIDTTAGSSATTLAWQHTNDWVGGKLLGTYDKTFYGTSENAVKTQIWIAVSVYVQVAIVRKRLGIEASLYQLLQIFSVTLFEKTPILHALQRYDSQKELQNNSNQLIIFDF
jgi:hypothetical protein